MTRTIVLVSLEKERYERRISFDFRFSAEKAVEGAELATAVGADMPATNGYIRHEVIRDIADAGHVAVITFWHEQAQGEAVLTHYINDDKIQRVTELSGTAPTGFLGLAQ